MDCKEYAKEIRAEIKGLIKKGTLPIGKYSVTSKYNLISITIIDLPIAIVYNNDYDGTYNSQRYTVAGIRILELLNTIARRHQIDANAGDWSADYCNCNYYTSVQYGCDMEIESYKKNW